MKIVAKPIEVLAVFSPDGKIRPYRFRIPSEEIPKSVVVDRVLNTQEEKIAGIHAIRFDCRSVIDEREVLYQLRYQTQDQCWILFKI